MAEGWDLLSSETHYEDGHLAVCTEQVRSPAVAKREWTVVHRKAAVVVAAITREFGLILIREERIPIRAAIWGVPAGQVDDRTATDRPALEAVALRELEEETGYRLCSGGEVISLGHFFSSPVFRVELGHLFLIRPVEPGTTGPAPTESESILDCRAFSQAEIRTMVQSGEICDANTLSVWARLAARGHFSR